MKNTVGAGAIAAVIVLVGCQAGGSPTSAPSPIKLASSVDRASLERGESAYQALVAQGFVYRISGRVSNIAVTMVNGKTHVTGTAIPGESVEVRFVKGPHDTVDFDKVGQRGTMYEQNACGDCYSGGGGSSGTPSPQQTAPPNYDSCRNAGGATWFDNATGAGGCLGPGASKGFPCGIWSYSSPGRGRFRDWAGTTDYSGFEWFSSNADGGCNLGPLPT